MYTCASILKNKLYIKNRKWHVCMTYTINRKRAFAHLGQISKEILNCCDPAKPKIQSFIKHIRTSICV